MSLDDLDRKLDDIISKISDCCVKVESSSQAISDVGQAVAVSDQNSSQRSEVLGAQMRVSQEECKSFFTLIDNSQRGQIVDLREIIQRLADLQSVVANIEIDTSLLKTEVLEKEENINNGQCTLDSTGLKSFNDKAKSLTVRGFSDFLVKINAYLVDIHKTVCGIESSNLGNIDLTKIWKLLGGDDLFFATSTGEIIPKIVNPEKAMRKDINNAFYPMSPDAIKGDFLVKHLPDYLRAITATDYYRSGHDRYPVKLPEDFTLSLTEVKQKLGVADPAWTWTNLTPEQEEQLTVELDSDLDYQFWRQKNDYDVFGKFPYELVIEKNSFLKQDIDITETKISSDPARYRYTASFIDAPQDTVIEFSSISDSFAELYGFLLIEATNNKLVKELNSRQMFEVAAIRQMLMNLYSKFESFQAYVGYKVTEKPEEYWLTFNPSPKEVNESEDEVVELLNFLKPSKVYYTSEQFSGKSNETLEAKILDLLTASTIIKGIHTNQIKNAVDISAFKARVKTVLSQGKDLYDELLADPKVDDDENPDKTEFDEWLEEGIEKGFSKQIGDIDNDGNPKNPYGRDREERPQIKRFKGDV